MTLFWDNAGPSVRYMGNALEVSDLNPEAFIIWRMSRWELFKMGMRCMVAAVRR